MSLYVRSPSGLLHLLKIREDLPRFGPTVNRRSGLYRTVCGRLVERGWSQRPRRLRDPGDPHVCGTCRWIDSGRAELDALAFPILGTREEIDKTLASGRKMERDLDAKRIRRERAS